MSKVEKEWNELFDQLLPKLESDPNYYGSILETCTKGNRIIPSKEWNNLFENGNIQNIKKPNKFGKRSVPFLEDKKSKKRIYMKFQPQFPSMEIATQKFIVRLFGVESSSLFFNINSEYATIKTEIKPDIKGPHQSSKIMKEPIRHNYYSPKDSRYGDSDDDYEDYYDEEAQRKKKEREFLNSLPPPPYRYPILISEGINGDLLHEVLRRNDPLDKLKKLCQVSLSKLLISTMIINPAGGDTSDYIVSPIIDRKTGSDTGKFSIVSIDNDLSFVPGNRSLIKLISSNTLNCSAAVYSALYFLNEMHNPIHQQSIDVILALNIDDFLDQWCNIDLLGIHNSINNLIENDKVGLNPNDDNYLIHRNNDDRTFSYLHFPYGSIRVIYSKLFRLKGIIKRCYGNPKRIRPITHWELLQILEPTISNRISGLATIGNQLPSNKDKSDKSTYISSPSEILRKYEKYINDEYNSPIFPFENGSRNGLGPLIYVNKSNPTSSSIIIESRGVSQYKSLNSAQFYIDYTREYEVLKEEMELFNTINTLIKSNIPSSGPQIDSLIEKLKQKSNYLIDSVLEDLLFYTIDFANPLILKHHQHIILDILLPTKKDIHYLRVNNSNQFTIKTFITLPFLNVLTRVEICNCKFLISFSSGVSHINTNIKNLHSNLGGSVGNNSPIKLPALQYLKIDNCFKLKVINIQCANLKTLKIINSVELLEYEVYSPNLIKLKLESCLINKTVLKKIHDLSNVEYISLQKSQVVDCSPYLKPSLPNKDGRSTPHKSTYGFIDPTVKTAIMFNQWKNLVTFNASNVVGLEKIIITEKLPRLTNLNFYNSFLLDEIIYINKIPRPEEFINIFPYCQCLETLDLDGTSISNKEDELYKILKESSILTSNVLNKIPII